MKKLLIFCLMLIALPALAATVCVDDDVIAIILDPEINGTDYTSDDNLFEWGVTFPYGSVWGIATCMDVNGQANVAINELRSENGETATGGERKGQYCWCQMTHPAVSSWIYRDAYSSVDECRSGCPGYCGRSVRNYRLTRASMFGSLN